MAEIEVTRELSPRDDKEITVRVYGEIKLPELERPYVTAGSAIRLTPEEAGEVIGKLISVLGTTVELQGCSYIQMPVALHSKEMEKCGGCGREVPIKAGSRWICGDCQTVNKRKEE